METDALDSVTDEQIVQVTELLLKNDAAIRERHYGPVGNPHPYDGVRGHLPEWMPDWAHDEYFKIQQHLVDDLQWGQVRLRKHVINYGADEAVHIRKHPNGTDIDRHHWNAEIGKMAHFRWIASLDPVEGLKHLGDSLAASGYAHREGQRRGGEENAAKYEQTRRIIRKLTADGMSAQKIMKATGASSSMVYTYRKK